MTGKQLALGQPDLFHGRDGLFERHLAEAVGLHANPHAPGRAEASRQGQGKAGQRHLSELTSRKAVRAPNLHMCTRWGLTPAQSLWGLTPASSSEHFLERL